MSETKLYCAVGYIYKLLDPETKEIRYIGQTQQPFKRFKTHLAEKGKRYKVNWIKSLKEKGQIPVMEVFQCVPLETLGEQESLWIAFYKKEGCNLTNSNKAYSLDNYARKSYSKYIGVSFSKADNLFIAFIEQDGFKYIGGFKDEADAKKWHDIVAAFYGLPVNNEPEFKCSLDEAKLLIKKEKTQLGLIGVTRVKNSYVATIMLDRKDNYLGCFKTPEEAVYYADATRNFYGLTNNQTTQDKLSVDEAKLKIAQSKLPKGVRKTGKSWCVRININKQEHTIGKIKTLEQAIYLSDALRNYYGLPNTQTTTDKLSLEDANLMLN